MLTKEEKAEILKDKKSGGEEAQILLLSRQIEKLFSHLKENPKDIHSKRGLLQMVNQRKKLLKSVREKDEKKYKELISQIGLKK